MIKAVFNGQDWLEEGLQKSSPITQTDSLRLKILSCPMDEDLFELFFLLLVNSYFLAELFHQDCNPNRLEI